MNNSCDGLGSLGSSTAIFPTKNSKHVINVSRVNSNDDRVVQIVESNVAI